MDDIFGIPAPLLFGQLLLGLINGAFYAMLSLGLAEFLPDAGFRMIFPIMLIVDQPWTLPAFPSASVWASLVGLALLSTALAYVLYFRILAAAGATNLLLVTFLIPATAILLGASVLGEHLLPRHFVGMALIGLSLAAIDGRLLSFLHTAK